MAITLFNGTQGNFFPTTAPSACLAAFNTSLNCDVTVQLLNTQTEWVGWNHTNLTTLCTSSCYNSLVSLESTVSTACGSYAVPFNGGTLSGAQILDYYQYKFNRTCLADGNTFCLMEEATWNIPNMVADGNATWPENTNKTYPNWYYDPISGTPEVINGTTVQPWQTPTPNPTYTSVTPAALDYFYTGGPTLAANAGWNSTLEYDEYPTQIQCSPCWLNRFELSFASQWGEQYNEVMAQVWQNMQSNCNFKRALNVYPDLNISGPPITTQIVQWKSLPSCDQNVTVASSNGSMNLDAFAYKVNVTSAGLTYKNGVYQGNLPNGSYCAPLSCAVMTVPSTMGTGPLLLSAPQLVNVTLPQFAAWNPDVLLSQLRGGEVVCIGPPGGAYVPPTTTVAQASPSVYTTTATPVDPTPSGTISNCGFYYAVQPGDYCNLISLNFSITFSQLVDMNPQLNSNCSNLLAGFDYCVAPVNGTNVPVQTTTVKPGASTSVPSHTASSTTVAPPAPTTSGTTSTCYKWYTVQSGDSCYIVEQAEGITFTQFQTWNTQIDTNCDNLLLGYSYCVSGP